MKQGNLRNCSRLRNCTKLRSRGKVDWWSLFAPVMARYRFVFGSSSALLARRVLVLFVFAMDFVLVWTLVLWYTGRRFRVHWTLIFQFVWALVAALCLGGPTFDHEGMVHFTYKILIFGFAVQK
jgi:hypothetical protein